MAAPVERSSGKGMGPGMRVEGLFMEGEEGLFGPPLILTE